MNQIISTSNTPTMSSIELVELINQARSAGRAKLLHKSFVAKIEKHPGIDSAKYFAQYKDASGRYLKCYNLPKRESELMVMSESLEVQTKVYDRLSQLETAPAPVALSGSELILMLAQQNVTIEKEQQRQAGEVARLQETVAVLEARTQPENKHFTVLGYANLTGHKIDYKTASLLGRKGANLSREQGLHIGDISDPRFGRVHSYHESVLKAVVGESRAA